jgi:hypothetical protein
MPTWADVDNETVRNSPYVTVETEWNGEAALILRNPSEDDSSTLIDSSHRLLCPRVSDTMLIIDRMDNSFYAGKRLNFAYREKVAGPIKLCYYDITGEDTKHLFCGPVSRMVTTQLAAGMDQGVHPVHVFGDEAFCAMQLCLLVKQMYDLAATRPTESEDNDEWLGEWKRLCLQVKLPKDIKSLGTVDFTEGLEPATIKSARRLGIVTLYPFHRFEDQFRDGRLPDQYKLEIQYLYARCQIACSDAEVSAAKAQKAQKKRKREQGVESASAPSKKEITFQRAPAGFIPGNDSDNVPGFLNGHIEAAEQAVPH